jgi:antitoxin (DNA-binding transcriptional repressor) of toxin-antitoxin stability system
METIHISEAEAAANFAGFMARIRAGTEIIIQEAALPAVVLRMVAEPTLRRLSESLRLAKEHGSMATLDGGFADDLEAIVNSHAAPLGNLWD